MAMKPKRLVQAKAEIKLPSMRVYDPTILSPSDIVINRALDVVEVWIDRYLVTPLLGSNQSAAA
jgi:hypothetical protein